MHLCFFSDRKHKFFELLCLHIADDSDASVVEAVKNSAKNAGAHAMVISVPTPGGVGKAADPDRPVDALSAALLCADVWIEFNHQWLLYSTPFERAEAENKKMRYMCDIHVFSFPIRGVPKNIYLIFNFSRSL